MKWTPCADCGTPCAYYVGSFYRCRQCGYESISGSDQVDGCEPPCSVPFSSLGGATVPGVGPRASAAREPEQLGLSL